MRNRVLRGHARVGPLHRLKVVLHGAALVDTNLLVYGQAAGVRCGTGLYHRLLLLTLDTHGMVRCTSAPAMVGMVGVACKGQLNAVTRLIGRTTGAA